MRKITLGSTGITAVQNGFGALPIQRVSTETAVSLLQKAYEGGMRFFDTARAYSDSEEKVGIAFDGMREKIYLATKSQARDPESLKRELDTSLTKLRTDYLDIYQLHCVDRCYRPDDGTGLYEYLEDAKRQGMIRHIGITTHKLFVAKEIVESGLYETIQYPLSYLSSEKELELVRESAEKNMGYLAMKGLAGGLITNAAAAMAFMLQFDNVMPIWGVQRERELDDWLSFMEEEPQMTDEIRAFIEQEKKEMDGEFCRGCGYCMPCPAGITINQCARMSLMLRRAPSKDWLTPHWQEEMKKIEGCLHCGACMRKCPYELNTPQLLQKNYEDYRQVLAGKTTVQ